MSGTVFYRWQHWPHSAQTLLQLMALLCLALLPHLTYLPIWIPGFFVLASLWRLHIELAAKSLPPRWLRNTLAVVLMVPLLISMGGFNGFAAGSGLLTLMAGMKLLEARSTRDYLALVFVVLFLLFAALLYQQSLIMLPYLLLNSIATLALLMRLVMIPDDIPLRDALWRSGKMLLQALPLAAVLFVLVPRLPGQIWALPSHNKAMTGLSDHISPGDIAELKQSSEVAFRVRFADKAPTQTQRYWRAIVLNEFDGRTWRQQRAMFTTQFSYAPDKTLSYRMLLEPGDQPFIPVLDMPLQSDLPRSLITPDRQLISFMPVTQLTSINMIAAPAYQLGLALSDAERRQATSLPRGVNPRTHELAHTWRTQSRDDANYVQRLMRWIHDAEFHYTLTPPQLGANSVDEFLFTTQRGYCEHYASALAFLLRAANIPARVVAGYQGGEFNPVSGYWVIRQSDAHAWVEAWLPEQGWIRLDPTAAIAPQRVEQGLALPDLDEASDHAHVVEASAWLTGVQQRWDAVNTFWKERIVEFDRRKQQALFSRLGIHEGDWRTVGLLLSISFAMFFVGLTLWLAWQQRSARMPVEYRLWQQFIRKLARLGIHHQAHEGPHDFAIRASQQRPELSATIESFTRAYLALRYGPEPATHLVHEMRRQLGKLPTRHFL